MSSSSEQRHEPEAVQEGRRERAGRYSRRTALYASATLIVLALIAIVILVAENTRRVKVGWIFGYSHTSLVFLILFSAILGWLLGIATSVLFRRRTRRAR
ncbi:MAG: lipopolysaccharide assembly protein LapA domain-containing protein [Actinomycetota bacterium]|nr:lipopolysaccharide assembly protein LapA domain-containing protein [Actinomycetota bacterium]